MTFRVLILGGTTEARVLAERLAGDSRFETTISLAGRTANPISQPVPVRTGGFGGPVGLAQYLRDNGIDVLVDATHPFAANISRNAIAAASAAAIRLISVRRPQWQPEPGDKWRFHSDIGAAIKALGTAPRHVFVTLGRQELEPLCAAPQHFYLIRSVDPVEPPLAVPNAEYILHRGPFDTAAEEALLLKHRIDAIVAKNSGGEASRAKLVAARRLAIPVEMISRPPHEGDSPVATAEEAMRVLDHWAASTANRGE